MRLDVISAATVVALLALACNPVRIRTGTDAGLACAETEKLVNGECRFVCNRDGDCATGQRCNLLTATCEPKPMVVDAGPPPAPCTEGALRCSLDATKVERCGANGQFQPETTCMQPDGFCQHERCLACRPGITRCRSDLSVSVCEADGSGFAVVPCANGAVCDMTANECRECTPGAKRCSPDGRAVQECRRLARDSLGAGWVNAGDNLDGTCITQQCQTSATSTACRQPDCVPGATQCKNATTQQTCNATGFYEDALCSTVPGMGPTAECQGGGCVDECADAARAKSYFGCEYWAVNLDNAVDRLFKGNTASGQGSTDSDFVFVVTNQSTSAATVTVQRWSGSAATTIKTVQVPGRLDTATKGLVKISVPWQSLTPTSATVGTGVTARARYGYRIASTKPITVYQFNPIDALKLTKSCSGTAGQLDCSCNELSGYPGSFNCSLGSFGGADDSTVGTCTTTASGKKCGYFTFSNDASLLLPAHILGMSYVAIAPGTSRQAASNGTVYPSQLSIVATDDATTVTVRASAPVAAGTGITAMARGESRTFTLDRFEVLQLSAGNATTLQCTASFCRLDADLTGTIVTSTKPVAMFSGHPCANVPYDKFACDHLEEQIFPFNTWGKSFVAVPANPLRLTSGGTSSTPPSYYKVVAGCPASVCPSGTVITVQPPPSAADVLAPIGCAAGTNIAPNNNCRLPGGAFVEFRSTQAFTVVADQPVSLAQFLAGQEATSSNADQGDPSMILLPPVEQWRSRYTVLAATGLQDNFIGIAIDSTRVQSVLVDGVVVQAFQGVGTSAFRYKNHPVGPGTHTVQINATPGQTTLPGAGVTVYGYDSYVSYGYTGGLDLSTIVTGINPGG